jgi:hypothetical protein
VGFWIVQYTTIAYSSTHTHSFSLSSLISASLSYSHACVIALLASQQSPKEYTPSATQTSHVHGRWHGDDGGPCECVYVRNSICTRVCDEA